MNIKENILNLLSYANRVSTLVGKNGLGYVFSKLTSSITSSTAALGGFIAVAAGIAGVVALLNHLEGGFQRAVEKSAASKAAYEESKSQLEQVNSELETTQSRMNELNAKEGLTLVEEQELTNLKQANDYLLKQKELLEAVNKRKQLDAAKDAADVLNEQVSWSTGELELDTFLPIPGEKGVETPIIFSGNIIDRLKSEKQAYNNFNDEYEKLNKEYETLRLQHEADVETHGGLFGEKTQWEKDEESLRIMKNQIAQYKNNLNLLETDIINHTEEVNEQYKLLFDDNGQIIPGFEEQVVKAEDALFNYNDAIETVNKSQEKLNSILSDETFVVGQTKSLKKQRDELFNLAKANKYTGITADDVTSNYKDLVDAVEAAGFTVEDVVNTINSEAEVKNIAKMKSQLRDAFSKDNFDISLRAGEQATQEFDNVIAELSDKQIEIVYTFVKDNQLDISDMSIEEFNKNVLQKAFETYEEKISLKDIFKTEEAPEGISEAIDSYQSSISSLSSTLEELKTNGSLEPGTITDVFQEFADLEDYTDNINDLQEALSQLTLDKLGEAFKTIDKFAKDKGITDTTWLQNIKNDMIDAINFSNFDNSKASKNLYDLITTNGTRDLYSYSNIEKLISQFGGTELGNAALNMLSLQIEANPELAYSSYEELVSMIESNIIHCKIDFNESDISSIEQRISNIASNRNNILSDISLKEAKGESVSERDYNKIINLDKQNLELANQNLEKEQENYRLMLDENESSEKLSIQRGKIAEAQADSIAAEQQLIEDQKKQDAIPLTRLQNRLNLEKQNQELAQNHISALKEQNKIIDKSNYDGITNSLLEQKSIQKDIIKYYNDILNDPNIDKNSQYYFDNLQNYKQALSDLSSIDSSIIQNKKERVDALYSDLSTLDETIQNIKTNGKISDSEILDLKDAIPEIRQFNEELTESAIAGFRDSKLADYSSEYYDYLTSIADNPTEYNNAKKYFQDSLGNLVGESIDFDQLKNQIKNNIESQYTSNGQDISSPLLSNYINQLADEQVALIKEAVSINDIGEAFDKTSSDVDRYTASMNALKSAQDDYTKSGELSAETIKSLSDAGYDAQQITEGMKDGFHDMTAQTAAEFDTWAMKIANDLRNVGKEADATAFLDYCSQIKQGLLELEGYSLDLGHIVKFDTTLYGDWKNAQGTEDAYARYNEITSYKETADKLFKNGWYGVDDLQTYAKILGKNEDTLKSATQNYQARSDWWSKYLTEDSSGTKAFFNMAIEKTKELDSNFVRLNSNGTFDVQIDSIKEFADNLGITTEMAMYELQSLQSMGYSIDFDFLSENIKNSFEQIDMSAANAGQQIQNVISSMIQLGQSGQDVSGAVQTALDSIKEYLANGGNQEVAQSMIDSLNEFGKLNGFEIKGLKLEWANGFSPEEKLAQVKAELEAKTITVNLETKTVSKNGEVIKTFEDDEYGTAEQNATNYSNALEKVNEARENNNSILENAQESLSGYTEEQLRSLDMVNGAYDNTFEGSQQAEQALDNIATKLGLGSTNAEQYKNNIEGLIEVLKDYGLIEPPETPQTDSTSEDTTPEPELTAEEKLSESVSNVSMEVGNVETSLSDLSTAFQQAATDFTDVSKFIEATYNHENSPKDVSNTSTISQSSSKPVAPLLSPTLEANVSQLLPELENQTVEIEGQLNVDDSELKSVEETPVEVPASLTVQNTTEITPPTTEVVTNTTQSVDLEYEGQQSDFEDGTQTVHIEYEGHKDEFDDGKQNVNIDYQGYKSQFETGTQAVNVTYNGLKNHLDPLNQTVFVREVKMKASGTLMEARVNGTPRISSSTFNDGYVGTIGKARANGQWGEKEDTKALTGELGRELVVRDNKFFTVGDNGPEMVNLKKGDIVFNHRQTEDILSKGYTTGRGNVLGGARANGTIGEARDLGDGGAHVTDVIIPTISSSDNSTINSGVQQVVQNVQSATTHTKKSNKKNEKIVNLLSDKVIENIENIGKYIQQQFDWIQVRLEYLQRKADNYYSKYELFSKRGLIYGSNYKKAKNNLNNSIDYTTQSIKANKASAVKYDQFAKYINKKQLKTFQKKAGNKKKGKAYDDLVAYEKAIKTLNEGGIIDLTQYSESVKTAIENYKNYKDSADACRDSVLSLTSSLLDQYEALYNLPLEYASEKLERINYQLDVFNANTAAASAGAKNMTAAEKNALLDQQHNFTIQKTKANKKAYDETLKNLEKFGVSSIEEGQLALDNAKKNKAKQEALYESKSKEASDKGKDIKKNKELWNSLTKNQRQRIKNGKTIKLNADQTKKLRKEQKKEIETYNTLAKCALVLQKALNGEITTMEELSAALNAAMGAGSEYAKSEEELIQEQIDAEKEKFENVKQQYENEIELRQKIQDMIQARGEYISSKEYDPLINKRTEELNALKNQLQSSLGTIEKGKKTVKNNL